MESGVAFAAVNTRDEGIKVTGKVGFSGHPMIEHYKFVAEHTKVTPKITIPAPSAIYGRPTATPIDRSVYPGQRRDVFHDLGQAYRKAVRAFADAGCRYLQLDEVFIAMLCDEKYRQQMRDRGDDPEKLGEIYGDLINAAMSDIPADMTITMHMCRGNYKSTFMGAGGYDAVQEILFNKINVHGYFMEYDDARSGGFEPLRMLPKGKQVVLGIVTTKTGKLESKDDLKRRIDEAAKFAPLDQLCLSGQCGFASTEEGNMLTEDEQWAKLRRIVEVAEEVWDRESEVPEEVKRDDKHATNQAAVSAPTMSAASCAPPPIKDARAKREKGEITAEQLKAVEDAEIKKIIAKQEECGLQARHRRRIPPLVVAFRFPLRPRRRRDEADRARHPVRRRADQGGAAGHRRQDRLLRPSDDRALQVSEGEHARHAEDDDPVADAAAFPLRPRRRSRRRSIPTSTSSSTISARPTPRP